MSAAEADTALGAAAAALLGDRRLIIATNRGPVTFVSAADGSLRPRRGSGGLVTALGQVGRHVPVTWVAAAMSEGDRRAAADPRLLRQVAGGDDAIRLRFASVERPVYEAAYNVIANPLLWFLQHQMWNLPERPVIDAATMRAWERGYVAVNEAFARPCWPRRGAIASRASCSTTTTSTRPPCASVAPARGRSSATSPTSRGRRRASGRPSRPRSGSASPPGCWPTTWSASRRSAMRTTSCAWSSRSCPTRRSTTASGRRGAAAGRPTCGTTRSASTSTPRARIAGSRAARRRADQLLGGAREKVIVRVDRLEPSKNILRGFLAYEALLQRHPRLRGRISFLAFLVPSRTGPARVRRLRPQGAERGRPHQRPLREGGLAPGPALLRERLRAGPGRASRSPTSCSSTRWSTA